jgi:hypothetical protein
MSKALQDRFDLGGGRLAPGDLTLAQTLLPGALDPLLAFLFGDLSR